MTRCLPGRVARVVERSADRADAAVHHVARADGVGAGLGVADRGSGEQLDRRVIRDLAVLEHAAVAVRRIRAKVDTSVSRTSSGNRVLRAFSASWMSPSLAHAPEPSSSFSEGTPNRITPGTRASTRDSTSCKSPSTVCRPSAASPSFVHAAAATNRGITRSETAMSVSRARPRRAPVRRKRLSRVAGNGTARRLRISRHRRSIAPAPLLR